MQPHPVANFLEQIWLELGKNLGKFGRNWKELGKFVRNLGKND